MDYFLDPVLQLIYIFIIIITIIFFTFGLF